MAITPYRFVIVSLLGYNGCMKVQERVDIIAKKLDIVKSKAIGFMAISGGSWVYALTIDETLFKKVLFVCFAIASYGVFIGVLKLSDLHNELKGLK
jgi:hypothetical protein